MASDPVTRSACAKLLGVKVRQFDNLVADGLPFTKGPRGTKLFDGPAVLAWYTARNEARRPAANGARKVSEDRLAEIRARMAELDLIEREGSLVDVDFVVERERALLERFRSKLAPLPGKLASRMVGVRDYGEGLARIKPLWDELLAALAMTGHELAREFGNGNGHNGASSTSADEGASTARGARRAKS